MVTIDDVRSVAIGLPRTTEAFVRGRVKFRVGRIVYLAFSRDETMMGFAFPKEWREALVDSEPDKFMLPRPSDLRYNWVVVRLDAIEPRCASSWSMPGRWSCRRVSPQPMRSSTRHEHDRGGHSSRPGERASPSRGGRDERRWSSVTERAGA